MRTSKKIVSLVLAVMMVVSMMAVMAVSVSAATTVTTVAEFNAIADADGEYVLGADINLGNGYLNIPEGRTVTIDFADYTFTSKYGFENHGTLTVKATTGGATATGYAVFENYGTLTVESGTYSGNYGVYAMANSTTTINNGTFTAQECCVCTLKNTHDATITIKKGTFTSADNSVLSGNGTNGACNNTWTISGGTYNANIESAGYVAAGIYAPNDDTWTISGGTFNVTNGVGIVQRAGVVNVNGGTYNVTGTSEGWVGDKKVNLPSGTALIYDSTLPAYPGSDPDDLMTVTKGTFNTEGDPVYSVAGPADTHINIQGGTYTGDVSDYVDEADIAYTYTDAQGKTQYFTSGGPTNFNNGTYTLYKDVTVTRMAMALFASDVTLDLNGHTITTTSTDATRGGILMSRSATEASPKALTIKNGNYVGNLGIYVLENSNDLTIENCNITVGDDFAIVTNGTKTNNDITITDSTITSENVAIYKPSTGALTLTNTDVTGETAVYVKSGTVEINGGTFTGTGAADPYTYNGNGCNSTGQAVVIDNCNYPGGAPTVTINDGEFKSDNADASVASYSGAKEGATAPAAVEGFIYGGTFEGDVDNSYVAPGLVDESAGNGMFVIVLDTNPIKDNTEIAGYQEKISESAVRIWTSVDRNFLDQYAEDYGYVVANVTNSNKTTETADFSQLVAGGAGRGEQVISCVGTYNNGVGHDTYDDITIKINDMGNGNKVAARFYVKIDGVYYYAKYATTYDGIIVEYTA